MATNPGHIMSTPETQDDPVTWIGRDRPFERAAETPAMVTQMTPSPAPVNRRRWWIIGALVAIVLIAALAWKLMAGGAKPGAALADRGNIPLVSVIVPGQQGVTASVSFTGAIAARYDMPIGNEGDTGRIVGVYVEAGDHVKRGQVLAKIDDSVLVQQVNRLDASLEQARAQAALSAAEYKRAQGVEAAGALSAEDIEKRRATAVTDAANVKVVAAQLAEAQARLARARITAPVEGTVLTRRAEVGQIANPAAKHCSALRAAARSRCAARSPSRIWRRARPANRRRFISPASSGPSQAACACSGRSSIRPRASATSASS